MIQKLNKLCIFSLLMTALIIGQTNTITAQESKEEELFLVAQKAFDDGFYDVAIRYINQFLQSYPKSEKFVQSQLLLGQCYFFKSQYLKAYDIFHRLLKYVEYKDATLFWLGETYFKGADYQQAEKYYNQLVSVYPKSVYIPQSYYSLGWSNYEQGKFLEAKKIFQILISKFPAHQLTEDASFKLGECEFQIGNYDVATQYFKKYILRYPQSTRHVEAYFYVAEAKYFQKDFLTAVTYYAKTADISCDSKMVFAAKVSMGWSYLKLDKLELSRKYFEEAKTLAESKNLLTDDIYLGLASLHLKKDENEKAKEAYGNLISQFPNSPRIIEAHLGKANIEYILKNYKYAIKEYKEILDLLKNSPDREDVLEKAHYGLAWTYLKSGDIDQSIKTFEKIMSKTKSKIVKVSALTQIGDAYHDADKLDKAIEIYDRVLKNFPDSMYTDYVQFRLGIALLKQNKVEAATLSFQSLQANFPTSQHLNESEYYLGVAYYKKEDWRQAAIHMERYLKGLPRSESYTSEAYYILALSHFNLKEYKDSLEHFQEIIDNYSSKKEITRIAKLNIAKCLFELGDEKEAIRRFQAIQAKYPKSESAQYALLWLGDYYLEHSDFDVAIKAYKDFISQFPGSDKIPIVQFELGQAYQALTQYNVALKYYTLIDNKAPKIIFAKARLAIADIFAKKLDKKEAIDTYQNIIKTVPDFKRDAYLKLATLYKDDKMFLEAIEAYNTALASPSDLSEILSAELEFYLGDTYELMNDFDKAVETYLKIPYLYPDEKAWVIKAYLRVARIFENSEEWNQAKTIYDKIITFNPEEAKYAQERVDWINKNIFEKLK